MKKQLFTIFCIFSPLAANEVPVDNNSIFPVVTQSNTTYIVQEDLDQPSTLFETEDKTNVTIDLNGKSCRTTIFSDVVLFSQADNCLVKNGSLSGPGLACIALAGTAGLTVESITFAESFVQFDAFGGDSPNSDITIHECSFKGTKLIQATLINTHNVSITNSSFELAESLDNFTSSLFITSNSTNITVSGCSFANPSSRTPQVFISDTENITFENSVFSGGVTDEFAARSKVLIQNTKDVTFRRVSFSDLGNFAGYIEWYPGDIQTQLLTIEDCLFTGEPNHDNPTYALKVRNGALPTENITIANSIFSFEGVNQHTDIHIAGADDTDITNCIFDSTGTTCVDGTLPQDPQRAANILLGNPDQDIPVTNAVISNCILGGPSQIGIYSTTTDQSTPNSDILINGCLITAQEAGIRFENTVDSAITNSRISGVAGSECAEGIGIHLVGPVDYNEGANSTGNCITNTVVSCNEYGIIAEPYTECNIVTCNWITNNCRCQEIIDTCENKVCNNKICGPQYCCRKDLPKGSTRPNGTSPATPERQDPFERLMQSYDESTQVLLKERLKLIN